MENIFANASKYASSITLEYAPGDQEPWTIKAAWKNGQAPLHATATTAKVAADALEVATPDPPEPW